MPVNSAGRPQFGWDLPIGRMMFPVALLAYTLAQVTTDGASKAEWVGFVVVWIPMCALLVFQLAYARAAVRFDGDQIVVRRTPHSRRRYFSVESAEIAVDGERVFVMSKESGTELLEVLLYPKPRRSHEV